MVNVVYCAVNNFFHAGEIGNISIYKNGVSTVKDNIQVPHFQVNGVIGIKVIDNNDLMTIFCKAFCDVRPYKTCTACNYNFRH
ncbi:hypothetical protein SDC9_159431 [bioreactor metagenome]|uniref:Uncharacterized protein n=1 Tax=bioreactor metagenome TaxID=1076179 RepID=A0A645FFJ7_9ZZZZ